MTQHYRSARNAAFHRQGGLCYYCDLPMWLTNHGGFAVRHGLSLRQAACLQATGEHLVAQQDGGGHGTNVVAACHHCNECRHKFRPHAAPDADRYRGHVRQKVARRKWHSREIMQAFRGR